MELLHPLSFQAFVPCKLKAVISVRPCIHVSCTGIQCKILLQNIDVDKKYPFPKNLYVTSEINPPWYTLCFLLRAISQAGIQLVWNVKCSSFSINKEEIIFNPRLRKQERKGFRACRRCKYLVKAQLTCSNETCQWWTCPRLHCLVCWGQGPSVRLSFGVSSLNNPCLQVTCEC